jgi:hypothetical protein
LSRARRHDDLHKSDDPHKDIFIVELRAEPDCTDPIKALRELLKRALRSWGLRCVGISQRSS